MSDSSPLTPLRDAQPPFFAGIDLGGTAMKIGVVDDRGRSVYRHRIPTESERGPEDGAARMGKAVLTAAGELGIPLDQLGGVGLGSPGTMDVPAGMLLEPHNLPGWFNFPIRDRVARHCGLPVTFANDGAAAAYGEFWVGGGREFSSMVLFTLGTGVGCGIIIGDLQLVGENSHGAECGHIIVDSRDDARVCPCGQPGHLEAYASATAVIRRTEEAMAEGRETSLTARLESGESLSPLLLAQEAEADDAFSLEMIL